MSEFKALKDQIWREVSDPILYKIDSQTDKLINGQVWRYTWGIVWNRIFEQTENPIAVEMWERANYLK